MADRCLAHALDQRWTALGVQGRASLVPCFPYKLIATMADQESPYDAALEESIRGLFEAPWRPIAPDEVEQTCEWLESLTKAELGLWVRNVPRAQHPRVVHRLVARAFEQRHSNLGLAQELSMKAVHTAQSLRYPEGYRAVAFDLQAEALSSLAVIHRYREEFTLASETWKRCEEARLQGSEDRLLEGEVLRRRGHLSRAQRSFDDAILASSSAAQIFVELEEVHRAGKARLDQAIAYHYLQEPDHALDTAALAGQLIDARIEPEMGFALMHNTLFFLEAYKLPTAALTLFHRLKPMYEDMDSPLVVVRAQWLSGRLFLAGGQHKPAAKYFDAARKAFLAHGLTYDAALAGFDAARAWAHLRNPLRVQLLAEQMYEVFTAKEIPTEAAAAFELFVDAARASQADAAFMTLLADRLAKAPRP